MSKKKLIVNIDLDGVIVDWLNGMRVYYNKPENFYAEFVKNPDSLDEENLGALFGGEANFRKLMYNASPEFWFNLEFLPWGKYLLDSLLAKYEVAILSSPGNNPNAGKGKLLWQQKHYPSVPIILAKHKHLIASENKILIDDTPKKIASFMEFGGGAIRWPNQFTLKGEYKEEQIKVLIFHILKAIEQYRVKHDLEI